MRIEVDLDTCQGYASCVMSAPDYFDIDPTTSKVTVLQTVPSAEALDEVQEAIRDCPVRALRLVEDPP